MLCNVNYKVQRWTTDEEASAAAEFGLVFPLLFLMMLGLWDLGNGIVANQKTLAASQIAADLIGRQLSVNDQELAQAYQAARLALMPFPIDTLVIDVVSVTFDDDGNPVVRWQEDSAGGGGDPDLSGRTIGLGGPGGGAIAVQTTYTYTPSFAGTIINAIDFSEVSFGRGRKTAVVGRD